MILSYPNTVSVPRPHTAHYDHAVDLIDRLRALEEENHNLQGLVCYLLQKNETLRMRMPAVLSVTDSFCLEPTE